MTEISRLNAHLLKYSHRPEWQPLLREVWDEHVAMAAHHLELEPEHLDDLLDEQGLQDALFGIVFEDFATRRLPDGASFARTYLKRVGWREANSARKYLEGMADSRLGLYEVTEVRLNQGLMLRDLLHDGPSFYVREKAATRYLAPWDILAARVVTVLDEQRLTGGVLRLDRRETDALLQALDKTRQRAAKAGEVTPEPMGEFLIREMPQLVTTFWLLQEVHRIHRPLPSITNTDGEPLLFGEARIPLRVTASELAAKLDAAEDWRRAADESASWNWSGGASESAPPPVKGNAFGTYDEEGRTLRGTIELKEDQLLFTANSRERVERGLAHLQELLGSDLGSPLTSYTTVEAAMAANKKSQEEIPPPDIPPEEIVRIKREYVDRHYHQVLGQPIPALGDKTPRLARRSKAGRRHVIEWLKLLENGEARRAASQGDEAYDFTWMWQELGLLEERGK